MRRCLLLLLALVALVGVNAQPQPAPVPDTNLKLSKSLIAVKVTDLEKQVTAFGPLLLMIDQLIAQIPQTPGVATNTATAGLNDLVTKLKQIPGLNIKGDIWFAIMPPPPPPENNADAAAPAPQPLVYIILPLTDPQTFNAFLATQQDKNDGTKGMVIGNNGVLALNNAPLSYKAVNLDLTLFTKRDIAISVQISELKLDQLGNQVPPAALMALGPLMKIFAEQQKNIQRTEAGLAMLDNDLSLEGFVVPVPNSTLAKGLTEPVNSELPRELAGYLPEDVVYCGASGPMLKGSPGTATMILQMGAGFITMFLPPDRAKPFTTALNNIMAQCSQGRALGISPAPPAAATFGPSLLGVYRVTDLQAGKGAARGFIRETLALLKMMDNGGTGPKFTFTPEAEKVGDVPVDVLRMTMVMANPATAGAPKPGTPAAPSASAKPIVVEARLAYLPDRMLVTFGGGSKEQMTALIGRVQQKKAAYTTTARFKSLANVVPPTARGFETYAPLDMIKLAISFLPEGPDKKNAVKLLAPYGAQQTVISAYQDIRGLVLHGELRIPGEQLQFLFGFIKDVIVQAPKPAPKPAK